MSELALARALHVLGIVIWIGGVAMVTMVVLPAVRRGDLGTDRLKAFQAIEHRFVWLARGSIILVGITGYIMLDQFALWRRFQDAAYWWMHAMVRLGIVRVHIVHRRAFAFHRFFSARATRDPETAFVWLHRLHIALLFISLVTVVGSVAGAHGWNI